jgi:SAM-dependent methyltransferase
MSWSELVKAAQEIEAAQDSRERGARAWTTFERLVHQYEGNDPYQIQFPLDALKRVQGDRARSDIAILDHGCGRAVKLLYLFALGYTQIYGVDIRADVTGWNRFLQNQFGISEPRFLRYDGKHVPLPDSSIDFLMSLQVVEHVRSDVLQSYYAEEGRLLKPGGVAYHQVPHRLVPYDGHSLKWFVHYFPRPVSRRIYRMLGKNPDPMLSRTFLRPPWIHRRLVRRFIGDYEDLTVERFRNITAFDDYGGPEGLRRLVGRAVRTPVLGNALGLALRNFVMLDTLAVKSPGPATTPR